MKTESDRINELKKQQELIESLRQEARERRRADLVPRELLDQVFQSTSWRLTWPLRWISERFRHFKAGLESPTNSQGASEQAPLTQEAPGSTEALEALAALQAFLTSDARLVLPTSDEPELSIILVLFNRAELTFPCLRALNENGQHSFEVILVDNASTDLTQLLLERTRGAHIIRNQTNTHFLLAVNQAAQKARGRSLLILNNDTEVLPGSIASALETLEGSSDIGAVGGKIILMDGTLQEAGSIVWRDGSCLGYGRGDNPSEPVYMFRRDVDYCSGAFLLTRKDLFDKLGGLDEAYKPAYYEETDYCLRLREEGLRTVYDPNAVVLHHEFASSVSTQEAIDLQASHRQILVDHHRDSLQTHYPPSETNTLKARFAGSGRPRTLFIDDRVPHPTLGAGFPRARRILLGLLERNHLVTFYPMAVLHEEWPQVYRSLPREIEVILGQGPELLEDFLGSRRDYYDTLMVSRPHNMKFLNPLIQRYPEWFRQTSIIYDAEALFTLRETGLRRLRGDEITEGEQHQLIGEEVALSRLADRVVSVSELEGKAFTDHGVKKVFVLGHSIEDAETLNSFQDRSGFLFVGAIHEEESPNGDSVLWFAEHILPRIQSALDSEVAFTSAGLNNSSRIRQLGSDRIRITGSLDDLTDLYNRHRVFVAPTRFAAGVPLKIYEAAGRGIPVVATSLLAKQLGWRDGEHLIVADDAEAFASRCVELHTNLDLWETIRKGALERVQRDCSTESFESQLHAILDLKKEE